MANIHRLSLRCSKSFGESTINDGLVVNFSIRTIRVRKAKIVDKRARISASKNKTDLTNNTVNHVLAILLKLIGINRHRVNIAVTNQFLRGLTALRVIKLTIRVNTVRAILEQRMAKHIRRVIMNMLPHNRHSSAIAVLERIVTNDAPITTDNVVLSGVATKIVFPVHVCPFFFSL